MLSQDVQGKFVIGSTRACLTAMPAVSASRVLSQAVSRHRTGIRGSADGCAPVALQGAGPGRSAYSASRVFKIEFLARTETLYFIFRDGIARRCSPGFANQSKGQLLRWRTAPSGALLRTQASATSQIPPVYARLPNPSPGFR